MFCVVTLFSVCNLVEYQMPKHIHDKESVVYPKLVTRRKGCDKGWIHVIFQGEFLTKVWTVAPISVNYHQPHPFHNLDLTTILIGPVGKCEPAFLCPCFLVGVIDKECTWFCKIAFALPNHKVHRATCIFVWGRKCFFQLKSLCCFWCNLWCKLLNSFYLRGQQLKILSLDYIIYKNPTVTLASIPTSNV